MCGKLGSRTDRLIWLIGECKYRRSLKKAMEAPATVYKQCLKSKANSRLENGNMKVLGVWNLGGHGKGKFSENEKIMSKEHRKKNKK